MNRLPVAEEFCSLQGEGRHTGMAAYFVRLAGCDVGCPWCDSPDARDAGRFPRVDVEDIAARAVAAGARTVVVTGGEPLMHNLNALTLALHGRGLRIHLETSGTHPLSGSFDWICVSPKRHRPPLRQPLDAADELKVVITSGDDFEWAEQNAANVASKCLLCLQPEWSARDVVTPRIVEYIERDPRWRLSLQTHKYLNIR